MKVSVACLLLAACGSSSSTPADGATGDGATDGPAALDAGPLGEWTWHDVPGAICANGSATGLGINRGAGDAVLVYMSGGSACLDRSCSIGVPSMRKDGGFGAPQLQACVDGDCEATFPDQSLFARGEGASPFTDATHVFISNCAGDYYVGNNDHAFSDWTAQFHGSRNQQLFAAYLAASFPAASRVVLTGGSAGAVGALLNYWQWLAAFPATRVDLITDSFAFVFEDGPEWNYELHAAVLPPGCATCGTDYRTTYDFNASIARDGRIAVLDAEDNLTLDFATGYRYTQGLEDLQPRLDALANTRYFIADGSVHILVQHPLDSDRIDVEGAPPALLSTFLAEMQADGATWQSRSTLP